MSAMVIELWQDFLQYCQEYYAATHRSNQGDNLLPVNGADFQEKRRQLVARAYQVVEKKGIEKDLASLEVFSSKWWEVFREKAG